MTLCQIVVKYLGLAELHDFKQRYPDADIKPFLSRSSDFFKNVIERGLKFIEEKKRKEQRQGTLTPENNNPVSILAHRDVCRKRLKKLRALAGLEPVSPIIRAKLNAR